MRWESIWNLPTSPSATLTHFHYVVFVCSFSLLQLSLCCGRISKPLCAFRKTLTSNLSLLVSLLEHIAYTKYSIKIVTNHDYCRNDPYQEYVLIADALHPVFEKLYGTIRSFEEAYENILRDCIVRFHAIERSHQ